MRCLIASTTLLLGLAVLAGQSTTASAGGGDPKNSISDVMDAAHGKKGLLNKVKNGKASDADGKELLALYKDLQKNKPPEGSAEDWKKRTQALIEGAELFVKGKKDEGKTALTKAADCKGCHSVHKG